MSKWGWVIAAVAAIVIVGCAKQSPRRNGLFDGPRPGDEVEPEVKTFSPEDHYDLGMVYYSGGKFKEAEAQFMMALQERPGYPQAHVGLGYVYQFKALMEIHAGKAKDAIDLHEMAVKHFLKALEKDPKNVEALIGLAMVNYDEYQYFVPRKDEYRRRSLEYLSQARAVDPNDPALQANIAFHEAKYATEDKEYGKAVTLLSQVTTCDRVDLMTRVQAHHNLAGCLYLVGLKERAIEEYRKYLELFPAAEDRDAVVEIIADIQAEILGHK